MSLKHGLLGLLSYSSMTGYELDKAFKATLMFFWQAKTSQIYRELNAMENKGWLTSERVIQDEKPNKRVYSITNAGKSEFNDWLAAPETDIENAMGVKSSFLMRLFFAESISNMQAIEMLREYEKKSLKHSLGLSAAKKSIAQYSVDESNAEHTKYWKITLLFGEIFYRAGLEWAEKAIAILKEKE
jgi:DNA-binding PadR family transcriptional regulator